MAQSDVHRSVSHAASALPQRTQSRFIQWLCWSLVLVGLIPWRSGEYFTGGLDPVVIAKALLSLLALGAAFMVWTQTPHVRAPAGLWTVVIMSLYLVASMFGSWDAGTLIPSFILGVRLVILVLTIHLLVASVPVDQHVTVFLWATGAVGVVLALSGLGGLTSEGRLGGGLLPISPNQLALLLGVPVIGIIWWAVNRDLSLWGSLMVPFLLALIWFTGSRAGLLAVIFAVLVVLCMAPRISVGLFLSLAGAIPFAFYLAVYTDSLAAFIGRGGTNEGSITTLNSRTIAWQAAFSGDKEFWERWFGHGLSVKTVPVRGTYWDTQVLDSTWVSVYVQAGAVGLALLVIWCLISLARALSASVPYRSLWLALILYAVIRSIVQTGIFDTYVLFAVILFPALMADRDRRQVPAVRATGQYGDGLPRSCSVPPESSRT